LCLNLFSGTWEADETTSIQLSFPAFSFIIMNRPNLHHHGTRKLLEIVHCLSCLLNGNDLTLPKDHFQALRMQG
jgi:hypothetical protein